MRFVVATGILFCLNELLRVVLDLYWNCREV